MTKYIWTLAGCIPMAILVFGFAALIGPFLGFSSGAVFLSAGIACMLTIVGALFFTAFQV